MDVNRRTRYGWMALGGLVCLFAIVIICKLSSGNNARAEGPTLPPPPAKDQKRAEPGTLPPLGGPVVELPPPADATPPPPLASGTALPEITPTAGEVPAPPPPGAVPPPPPPPGAVPPPGADLPPATGSDARPILIPASGTASKPTPPPVPEVPPAPGVLPPVGVPSGLPAAKPEIVPVSVPTTTPAAPNYVAYPVRTPGMTFRTLARKALGAAERWADIHKLNPTLSPDAVLTVGSTVLLPNDALIDEDALQPLPTLRSRPTPRPKVALPLTGTFPVALEGRTVTLPRAVMEQLANCDTVLVSPGSSRCLWITNQAHLDRLGAKLDRSPAREADVQAFKRLYFAQITKLPVRDGRFTLTEKLAQFAGLHGEVVLVGIDDHFEVWDAAVWRKFTATRKAAD